MDFRVHSAGGEIKILGCRRDFTTFDTVRATAPVVFTNTRYDEFDLRGNDLSTIRGAASLDGVVVSRAQRPELAEALVAELDLRCVDDGER